jgi:hypothetical protein
MKIDITLLRSFFFEAETSDLHSLQPTPVLAEAWRYLRNASHLREHTVTFMRDYRRGLTGNRIY